MDINYTSGRKLNKNLINRLATCEYISEHRNLFITGATGCGKTYMACAFGMEACKQYFNTRYVRLPDLLIDLEMARTDGSYKKVMAKCANPVVLILDEWLLLKPFIQNRGISSNCSTGDARNLQRFSAPSINSMNGMTSSAMMPVLLLTQSLTASLMTVIVSISQALMPNMTSQCVKSMD